jgi:hypothetical protein
MGSSFKTLNSILFEVDPDDVQSELLTFMGTDR